MVVELVLADEDMRVRVGGDAEVALADELADARPRHPAQMQEADPPVPEVVRAEQRNAGGLARLRDRRAERVGARPGEQARIGVA